MWEIELTHDLAVLVLGALLVADVAGETEVNHGGVLRVEGTDVEAGGQEEALPIMKLLASLGEASLELRERESLRGDILKVKIVGCYDKGELLVYCVS